jgi:hypothetical protein
VSKIGRWLFAALGASLFPAALLLLPPGAAQAASWRPPMIVWTSRPTQVGFYFGPHFFSDAMGLTQFLERFGRDERTQTDSFGFKHLYFYERGLELTATSAGQILSFMWYLQPASGTHHHAFFPAQVQTDTGLGPGNTWNDVWLLHGPPTRQKVDELGDKLYVLEYRLGNGHDLDFYFRKRDSKERIYKLGLYPRR